MPLDPTVLTPLIVAQLQAEFGSIMPASYLPTAQANWLLLATAISNAIIPYLIANTIVNTGIPVATVGGPTAQTGATTAPGTIS
jgi:hypothetical protein